MEYGIISGDSHIDINWLPHDLFLTYAPARWKERVPRVVDTAEGKKWVAGGEDLARRSLFATVTPLEPPPRGASPKIDRMYEAGFYDGRPHPTTLELRLRDQELDGVDAEVIYGILGMATFIEDKELLTAIFQAYNTWLAEFCKACPERLVGLACLPNASPEVAIAELQRAANLGLRGADFAVYNLEKPIWHRDWDPFWAAAAGCNMPVSFHTLGASLRQEPTNDQMREEYKSSQEIAAVLLTLFQLGGAEYLSSVVFSGALERHPGFQFVLGECGVGWIPFILQRMDEEAADLFRTLNLPYKPSEYWYRQGYTTFQHELNLTHFVQLVGDGNIMWGSDYPHGDGVWPDSRKVIQEDLGGLNERVRQKITRENAGKLYGLIT